MATSGLITYTMTRDQIINDALLTLGAIGAGETVSGNDSTIAQNALNRLIKAWENDALHIWKKREFTLFLAKGQSSYQFGGTAVMGTTGPDFATESYVNTTTTATVSSGSTIQITSNAGFTNGDYLGLVLDSGVTYWSTVSSSTSTSVTIAGTVPSQATAGANVYDFTTTIYKPLDILDVRRRYVSNGADIPIGNGIDVPIEELAYSDYMAMPNKTGNAGTVVQWMYDRQAFSGYLYIWPAPADSTYILKCTYQAPLQDLDSSTDNPDLPQEWYEALVFGLAYKLGPTYGKTGTPAFSQLQQMAQQAKADALGFDDSHTYIQLRPHPNVNG